MGDDGDTFIWSVKHGEINEINELVKKGRDVRSLINGRHPLHYAADYGQREVIKLLLSLGADINAKDKFGLTPLLSAIYEGHTDCVELLLSKGADKTAKTPNGESYFEVAEKPEIKRLLQ